MAGLWPDKRAETTSPAFPGTNPLLGTSWRTAEAGLTETCHNLTTSRPGSDSRAFPGSGRSTTRRRGRRRSRCHGGIRRGGGRPNGSRPSRRLRGWPAGAKAEGVGRWQLARRPVRRSPEPVEGRSRKLWRRPIAKAQIEPAARANRKRPLGCSAPNGLVFYGSCLPGCRQAGRQVAPGISRHVARLAPASRRGDLVVCLRSKGKSNHRKGNPPA